MWAQDPQAADERLILLKSKVDAVSLTLSAVNTV